MRISRRLGRLGVLTCVVLLASNCSRSTLPRDAARHSGENSQVAAAANLDGSNGGTADAGIANGVDAAGSSSPSASAAGSQAAAGEPTGTSASGTADSGSTSIGVTKDSIAITASGLWSGAYGAFTNKQFDNGFMVWVNRVNTSGGIHGRKIVVKKVDNQATPEGAVAACKEERTNGTFMTVGLASQLASELDCLDQGGVPTLAMTSERDPLPHKFVRAIESEPGVGAALAGFAKSELGGAGKKIGVMVTQFGAAIAMSQGFLATARSDGLNVVAIEKVQENQGSFVAELSRMRSAGAEIVVLFVLTEALGVLRDAKAISYQPSFTGTIWTVDDLSQVARSLMDGIKGLRVVTTIDTPAYKSFKAEADRQGKTNASATDARLFGVGLVLGRILQAAGPNLTRESILAAIDGVKGFDSGVIQPVTWNPGDHIGTRAQFPVLCCDSNYAWKSLGPAQTFRS